MKYPDLTASAPSSDGPHTDTCNRPGVSMKTIVPASKSCVSDLLLVLAITQQWGKLIAEKSGAFSPLEAPMVLLFQQADGKVFFLEVKYVRERQARLTEVLWERRQAWPQPVGRMSEEDQSHRPRSPESTLSNFAEINGTVTSKSFCYSRVITPGQMVAGKH